MLVLEMSHVLFLWVSLPSCVMSFAIMVGKHLVFVF
uniref:Uncharacterized protein n=1 Tax=Arundo donax TaxID=35708 RepID=A0A0A9B3P6_ARUDO